MISLSLCWWTSFSIFFLPNPVERAAGQASGSYPRLTCHISLLQYYLSIFRSVPSFCLIRVLPKSSIAAYLLDPKVTVWEVDPASSLQSMRGEGSFGKDLVIQCSLPKINWSYFQRRGRDRKCISLNYMQKETFIPAFKLQRRYLIPGTVKKNRLLGNNCVGKSTTSQHPFWHSFQHLLWHRYWAIQKIVLNSLIF